MTQISPEQPNFLFVLTDQQRWDTTGVHGNPLGLTPNFDQMATTGTHLYHTYTPQPVCGPARSCLQTGRYATQTGCFRNGIPLPRNMRTLAHHFKEAGYQTGYIGKWHLASPEHIGAVPPEERGGYDFWLGANMLEFTSDAYNTLLFNGQNEAVKLPGYRVDALADAAIRFFQENQDKPFYLFLSFLEPHHQNRFDDYPAPDGYRERYHGRWIPPDLAALGGSSHQHLAGYFGMVKRLDEALGRILDALKSLGVLDDTVVIFTSDHGSHFKTRNNEYKRSPHDSSIRVPAAIRGPFFNSGGQIREMVSLLDLPPTLLDAAGISIPSTMEGRSLLPLLRREQVEWPEEVFVQISEAQVGRAVRTRRWKFAIAAPDNDAWNDSGATAYVETELYDMESDPYELTNLIGFESHEKVTEIMRERLLRRMVAADEPEPEIASAPRRSHPQRHISRTEAHQ